MDDIIQALAQSELLNGESVQMCTEDKSRIEMVNASPMELIPDEIIDKHIFIYFSLHYCIDYFRLVCKKWKHICERSYNPNRQLTLDGYSVTDNFIRLARLYQPTAIQFRLYGRENNPEWISIFSLLQLVRSSKRCHTLILPHQSIEDRDRDKISSNFHLPQITTLFIREGDTDYLDLFPNVQYLHILTCKYGEIRPYAVPKTCKTIVVSNDDRFFSKLFKGNIDEYNAAGLTNRKEMQKMMQNKEDIKTNDAHLSYKERALKHNSTRLCELIKTGKYDDALTLVTSETFSLETEIEFQMKKPRHFDYSFGSIAVDTMDNNEFSTYFSAAASNSNRSKIPDAIRSELYNQMSNVFMTIPAEIRLQLELFMNGLPIEELLQLIREILLNNRKRSTLILPAAFVQLLQRDEFLELVQNDGSVRELTIEILHKCSNSICKEITDEKHFDLISSLIDWNRFKCYSLLGSAIEKLFKNSVLSAIENGTVKQLNSKTFCQTLLRYINDTKDWDLFDALMVNNDVTLMDTIIRSIVYTSDYAVVETMIKRSNIDQSPYILLMNEGTYAYRKLMYEGVDPRKIPKNSETVLCAVIRNSELREKTKMEMIEMLLLYGVDINEPSLYEGHYHEILTIAKLTGQSEKFINFIKARGAIANDTY